MCVWGVGRLWEAGSQAGRMITVVVLVGDAPSKPRCPPTASEACPGGRGVRALIGAERRGFPGRARRWWGCYFKYCCPPARNRPSRQGAPEAAPGEERGGSRARLHVLGQAKENLPPATGQGRGEGGAEGKPRAGPAAGEGRPAASWPPLKFWVRPGSSGRGTWPQNLLQKSPVTRV